MNTTRRVQMTIDVSVSSIWDHKTTMAQVRDQAAADAFGMLNRLEEKYDLKAVGKPTVTAFSATKI